VSHNPEKDFTEYLYEELGLPKTSEDLTSFTIMDSLSKQLQFSDITDDERQKLVDKFNEEHNTFNNRYQQQLNDYSRKYTQPFWSYEAVTRDWHIIDSIYENTLKLKPGLMSDMIKTRRLDFTFRQMPKDEKENAQKIIAHLQNSLHEDFLKQETALLCDKYFSPDSQRAYELPDTDDALAFKEIIKQFKGKYVLVDFWVTWCEPCIHGIKESKAIRELYKDSKDVAFVYITSERDSPTDKYKELLKEQELTNSFRVSEVDYQYFLQLFTFNVIPHYVFVDRDGKILNNNTGHFDIERLLKESLENEK
jgi:thiol-disulfide isomerase/thioredoxin